MTAIPMSAWCAGYNSSGEDLHLVVEDKHSRDLYEIDGPFELGARCINWLDEILRTTVQLLSGSNTKTK